MAVKVLFVCIENSCRSQMAEALARTLGQGRIEAYSAGSRPSGVIQPLAIEAMSEIGIDISSYRSKGFRDLGTGDFDLAITLGCQDTCPFIPAEEHLEWKIDDPKGKDIAFFRRTRDQLRDKIEELLRRI